MVGRSGPFVEAPARFRLDSSLNAEDWEMRLSKMDKQEQTNFILSSSTCGPWKAYGSADSMSILLRSSNSGVPSSYSSSSSGSLPSSTLVSTMSHPTSPKGTNYKLRRSSLPWQRSKTACEWCSEISFSPPCYISCCSRSAASQEANQTFVSTPDSHQLYRLSLMS